MALPLIGLIGRARSGKNTVADMLAEHGYTSAAFADPLRDVVAAIDPIVHAAIMDEPGIPAHLKLTRVSDALRSYGYEGAKDEYPEYRRNMQATGTEGVREVLGDKWGLRELLGDDVWPAIAQRRINKALHYREYPENPRSATREAVYHWRELLAFTDVRFANEADLIKRNGGILVRVARPSLPLNPDAHVSETALDEYEEDYTIVNDGDLSALRVAVDTFLAKVNA